MNLLPSTTEALEEEEKEAVVAWYLDVDALTEEAFNNLHTIWLDGDRLEHTLREIVYESNEEEPSILEELHRLRPNLKERSTVSLKDFMSLKQFREQNRILYQIIYHIEL